VRRLAVALAGLVIVGLALRLGGKDDDDEGREWYI
jgi:hypothetical protein